MENSVLNILDKTDKSVMPDCAGRGSKVDRYGWVEINQPGRFELVEKKRLNIDVRYQRGAVSESKVKAIAANWDWLIFGCVSVIEREDCTLWVFDGGHRTRAAFYRNDISVLPCMVHQITDLKDEARAFFKKNTSSTAMASWDKFRAKTCADDPAALAATSIVAECGFELSGTNNGPSNLQCIEALLMRAEADPDGLRRVLMFLNQLKREASIGRDLLTGTFTLFQKYKDRFDILEKYGIKLLAFSAEELQLKIRQFKAETGKAGEVICAKALLQIINKRLQNKIEWN